MKNNYEDNYYSLCLRILLLNNVKYFYLLCNVTMHLVLLCFKKYIYNWTILLNVIFPILYKCMDYINN